VQASVLDKYSITIAIRPWVAVKDYGATPGELNPEIVRAFRRSGIVIPLPTLQTVPMQAVSPA
jgi:small-conductance mechanosensitive channel